MDPDANLEESMELARKLLSPSPMGSGDIYDDAMRLAELVLAMDKWISREGFLPRRWNNRKQGGHHGTESGS